MSSFDMELGYHDAILRKTLVQLREAEDSKKGVVAACLFTPYVGKAYAFSDIREDDRNNHAERNALDHHLALFGQPTSHSVMITSLSPCKKDDPKRYGVSCTDMLLGNDPMHPDIVIPNVHVGYIDPWQPTLEEYLSWGFKLTVTRDHDIAEACRRLFDYFLPENYRKVPIPDFVNEALRDF